MTKRASQWAAIVLHGLVILAFVPSAMMKLMQVPMAAEGMSKMGIRPEFIVPIGMVELLCVAIYLIPLTAVLGAFLLTGYLGGATLAIIIHGTDFLHALVVGLIVWAGVWLRVPELRYLLPLRRKVTYPQNFDSFPEPVLHP